MINFKISLLSPIILDNTVSFVQTVLTNFLDQETKNKDKTKYTSTSWRPNQAYFEYTFNEKFTEEENNQKTLSFEMNKTITSESAVYENPFINFLHVGSLILYEDKYENQHVFSVASISFDPSEFNIKYTIKCQDTFSYTTARQKDGYTITNDINSEDFIGAFDLDFWAQKIIKDCYINYDYLTLNAGLCQLDNGELRSFSSLDELENLNVKKIIKEAYSPIEDKEFFTTFPFEGSGSASSLLIGLGSELGMHLKVAEVLTKTTIFLSDAELHTLLGDDGCQLVVGDVLALQKFFWFEPAKNIKRLDSTYYSPRSSIQKFDMSYQGDSLTTVLNVQGPTFNDEEVTLIPAITPFFNKVFNSSNFWLSSKYESDMFTKLVKGTSLVGYTEGVAPEDGFKILSITWNDGFINIEIENSFRLKTLCSLYDSISSIYNGAEKTASSLRIITSTGLNVVHSYNSVWTLHIDNGVENAAMILDVDEIPSIDINDNTRFYITIPYVNDFNACEDAQVYLQFIHHASTEDLEFAKIADACPWLENKIIDFNYFLKNNIITVNEYSQLMNVFQNDLRRVNGQLLIYSYQYYNALHQRTTELANLTNSLDAIGASVQHLFVDNYAQKGINIDTTDFALNYSALFAKGSQNQDKLKSILEYDSLKADYLNKFCNAQQRFFKNIKNFKDYFNTKIVVPNLYEYQISFKNLENNHYIYTTEGNSYKTIKNATDTLYNDNPQSNNYGKTYYSIYRKTPQDNYIGVRLADASMLGSLYVRTEEDEYVPTLASEYYTSDCKYYKYKSNAYNLYSEEDIVHNYIQQTNKTYYYRTDLEQKQLTLSEEDDDYNNVLYQFKTWFKPKALCYVYSSPEIDWETEGLTWNRDYCKIFDAYLPISSYQKDNVQYMAATPENQNTFYRPCQPISLTGKVWGYFVTGATTLITGVAGHVFWACLSEWINSSKIFQTLDLEGCSVYDLTYHKISEYGEADIHICSSATEIYDKWCDSKNPFYTLNGVDGFIKDEEETLQPVIGVTPQLAAAQELEYGYNKLHWINDTSANLYIASSYVFIPVEDELFNDNQKEEFLDAVSSGVVTDIDIYPLLAGAVQLPASVWTIDNGTSVQTYGKLTFQQLINSSDGTLRWDSETEKLYITKEEDEIEVILCELRNYNLEEITNENFDYSKPFYDVNNIPVNMLKEPGVVYGLYKKFDDFVLATSFDIETQYYIKENNGYVLLNTINTLTPQEDYFYKADNIYTAVLDSEDIKEFTFDLIKQDKNTLQKTNTSVKLVFDGESVEVSIDSYDSLTFTKTVVTRHMNNIIKTNGDFWYNYHDKEEHPVFQTRAAGIEAQLTSYWSQAYTASKYCDYFLPEAWTTSIQGVANRYAPLLYSIIEYNEGSITAYALELLPTFIPDVAIYSSNGTTQLKKYRYVLDAHYPTVDSLAIKPISEMFAAIKADTTVWSAIESGVTTYYYNQNNDSGMTWVKFLELFNLKYPDISGQYKMGYTILSRRYKDSPQHQYWFFKEQQAALWRKIYQKYSFFILEKTYQNDSATTSSDLLKLAQFAFQDYSKPETNYNISIIDLAALANYDGSEVHIGDGIRIRATEYYESHDEVFKDLSQYLFITNISYECRKATDISLGVNTIKYQDKLIQKLISALIK